MIFRRVSYALVLLTAQNSHKQWRFTRTARDLPRGETAVQSECDSSHNSHHFHTWKGRPTHRLASHWDTASTYTPETSRYVLTFICHTVKTPEMKCLRESAQVSRRHYNCPQFRAWSGAKTNIKAPKILWPCLSNEPYVPSNNASVHVEEVTRRKDGRIQFITVAKSVT